MMEIAAVALRRRANGYVLFGMISWLRRLAAEQILRAAAKLGAGSC